MGIRLRDPTEKFHTAAVDAVQHHDKATFHSTFLRKLHPDALREAATRAANSQLDLAKCKWSELTALVQRLSRNHRLSDATSAQRVPDVMALTGMQQRKLLSQLRKLQTDEPGAGNHNKGVQFMPITVVVFGNSIRFLHVTQALQHAFHRVVVAFRRGSIMYRHQTTACYRAAPPS